ncbi:MAG: HD domain-containing protein [Candidatus Magasanikbacteria bacterium]|nr:HD domain-containing protein [Candidatus Magasanikbacteria bacterium]
MSNTNPYTHFQGENVSRAERVERHVVEVILESCSKIPDESRVWGKVFELKHSSSVAQFGRVLAEKRGLRPEIGAIVCVMHDIAVNVSGDAKDHAHKGAVIAEEYLRSINKFSGEEIKIIVEAIYEHSDKHVVSTNPYAELVKDADVLDCSTYEGTHDAYAYEKTLEACRKYFERVQAVRQEMGLPHDPQWNSIELINKSYAK